MIAGYGAQPPRTFEELLGRDLAARLDRLDVLSRKILSGKLPGERRSKRRGRSVEFDDFRNYVPGDDLRHIDWSAYARLDKLFIKLFREEEDLALHLIVDASASMDVGEPNKLVYACRLATALGYIGLVNQNRVSVAAFGLPGQRSLRQLAPLRGRMAVQRVAGFMLQVLSEGTKRGPGGTADPQAVFTEALRTAARGRAGRGIVVLLSDFLMEGGPLEGLRYLSGEGDGFDGYALQLLSPSEIDPLRETERGMVGDLRLTDVESGRAAEVTVTPATVSIYKQRLNEHIQRVRGECLSRGVAHFMVSTETPVEQLVMNTLRRGGLLRG